MRGIARRSWATRGIGAAGIAGLALVAAALMLAFPANGGGGTGVTSVGAAGETSTATNTPTATNTATATATLVPADQTATAEARGTATAQAKKDCSLTVDKTADKSTVPEDGTITYTITITNDGSHSSGECSDLTVTDTIPDDTDCSDATVTSDSDISEGHFDINGCDNSGDVTWETTRALGTDDQVVLTMVVDLSDTANDGDTISNEACATSTDDTSGDCDSVDTDVTSATATPTTGPTATTAPIATPLPLVAPVVVPTAAIAPLIIPSTGSGPDSSGGNPLALALGLAGGALVLLSGTGLWLRRRT